MTGRWNSSNRRKVIVAAPALSRVRGGVMISRFCGERESFDMCIQDEAKRKEVCLAAVAGL